jgi:para-aminobenzoate synthetase component I
MTIQAQREFLCSACPGPLTRTMATRNVNIYDLYRRVARCDRPSFLLESGGGQPSARYSFFGSDPYLVLRGTNDSCELRQDGQTTRIEHDPFTVLSERLRHVWRPRPRDVPPFFGGAVGFLSYDLVRRFERLPTIAAEEPAWPDLTFAFIDLFAAYDHAADTLQLLFSPPVDRLLGEPRDKLFREGCDRLAELEARLSVPLADAHRARIAVQPTDSVTIHPGQSRAEYMARVAQCQDYIRAGDIYQANLSHRFDLDLAQSAADASGPLYATLRRLNPSPFSALLSFDDVTMVSSSPERLVRRQDDRIETRPIAGTRGRGMNSTEDRRLVNELLANHKERAEHLMLVDLERNDLGRVCRYGTVRVDEFMAVEHYSHVNHLVSNVTGQLQDRMDSFDVIRAMFPGGTITGVPKIRCMEIIETLEPVRRGPYTGSLGYISWSGDLDLNIIIRTLILTGRRGYLQVGAGIVADSDPGREYDETMLKAGALIEALTSGRSRP